MIFHHKNIWQTNHKTVNPEELRKSLIQQKQKYTDIRSYPIKVSSKNSHEKSDDMAYNLDDWWQTPLGDSGMDLRDLIKEALSTLMSKLKDEKKLDEKTRDAFKLVLKVVDKEYNKLTN